MQTSFWISAAVTWVCIFRMPLQLGKILFLLPGTAVHELSHWITALVLGCRPGFPNLWPRRQLDCWTLGSVVFSVRGARAAFVALAPALLLLPLMTIGVYELTDKARLAGISPTLSQVLVGAFAGYFAHSAVPSSADIEIALQDPVGLIGSLVLLAIQWQGMIRIIFKV